LSAALDDFNNRIREIAELVRLGFTALRRGKTVAFLPGKRSTTMEWFHSTEPDSQELPQDSLASSHEIKSAFVEQRHYLNWVALIVTGDHALAGQAVINASDLSASGSSVFRDWLIGWTKSATVRAAVREDRDVILASASRYIDSSCEHPDNDVLSDDQIASLRHVDPRDVVTAIDPLARSALVLRGIQHLSIADCALLLDIPPRIVAAAYCRALRWNNERASAQGAPNEDAAASRL
jgi:DNA-directed RNA polymerase specialized sigma24 family protein